ncbi:hypothetical protein [Albimonas pacifica]|uniref:VPLPA-CTERM protein sorting domain-containing protein n=1 Tax=Albimonas pacifica TaxID=1114924 RepID=A0A1I3DTQ5_9RHOB|nr:hypothetical protein [Albimonas pacifica]SFH90120.1 hypothetical protein SAMN05216258_1039 [Albimonas pacifica]
MFAASRRAAGFVRAALAGIVLAVLPAVGAQALTVSESTAGEFSSDWSNPTEIGAGVDRVSGTGSANAYDILHFTGLAAGAQALTLSFVAPEGVDWSYAAGGSVLWSEDPFRWSWDGATAGEVRLDYYGREQTVTLALPDGFAGDLYLGLYFTHGAGLAYTILAELGAPIPGGGIDPGQPTLPGGEAQFPPAGDPVDSGSASPVPLPPALAMLGAGLAALGVASRRRRRAA